MAAKPSLKVFGAFLLFLVLQPSVLQFGKSLKLESLQTLEQAQKGDIVDGLNQVKQYFKIFGYYPHDIKLTLDDHFDDSLESALKAYQENFYLNVTGKIDSDTIKAMMSPRCGVADTIRNLTPNGTLHGNHGIFHFVSNYSFFPGEPRWTRFQLTYTFLPGVNVRVMSPIIARAFQRWAAVSPFRFRPAAQGTRADISIGFYRYDHGDGAPFDGPGNVLAHAFSPEDGRFHYDADEKWTSNPTAPDQIDLESVAIHELGHILGLDHSRDIKAIMYPTFQPGTIKRNLGKDDIYGLKALYGY